MKRTKLLPLLLSALLLLSAAGCCPAEAPAHSGGASSSVSSSTSSSGIPAPNDEVLPIDLAVLSGPTGVGAAYLMEYYAPEHVPADSPISVSSVVVTENSEATALLSNGEADIAAVATNVASNFYHKTDGSIQMLAVNTMGVLYILEKGDSIQSMADLQGKTIYASALGDPTNFYVYDGVSTDSYAVAVGTEGEFTGCIAYSSTVLFWKENCLHKVLGSYPAQYEIYTYTVPGIQKGSEKSLAVINETLFYKGRNGVYAYSGGAPELLTENFGTRRFFDAVGGTDGERYYISMRTEKGDWELYVFDTLRAIWLREDATHALDWAYLDGTLYFLDGATGKLMTTGQDYSEEGLVNWSATLCQMDETSHGRKCYSKLYLRADLEAGAWLKVEISTDGKPFRQVFSTHNERAKTLQVPILPVRCDNFRIRLSGKGGCLVKSIIREFALGSEY